ncbi:T9SS type A sorting domain-containing protein [Tamlana fucoidanivorans]|uniref:T9SS type A sorting domain-containing protein n=1 Tax=Allotamlana fucoidanivorans TaxID=2583814 RepID=A0A5C4SJY5_9FLAO|nr:zinc-dependent metalloprotease family protein [Tamlana fucoidanivorans]TNJ44133.1 T9SS type A sorting domain-containing protein [Tamlana fucoidanivorans]
MKAKLHYVLTTAILLSLFSGFAQDNYFTKIATTKTLLKSKPHKTASNKGLVYQFNLQTLTQALTQSNKTSKTTETSDLILSFPNAHGTFERFRIEETSVMHPDLQAKYPHIKSYTGYGIDNPLAYLRFSISPYNGLSGVVLGTSNTTVIEAAANNLNQIVVIHKANLAQGNFLCERINTFFKTQLKEDELKDADDSIKRTYKIALSVTGEYGQFNGGSLASVNAAINATLTNINAVFENEFNVSLQLVANNDKVIYLNPSTDPYTNLGNYNTQLATTLDTEILEANYDVGHLLGGIDDGAGNGTGDAGCIGCVCNNGGSYADKNHKGSGFSTSPSPAGINFDLDFVAHEIGHQFGATHTWTHDGSEGTNTQMEPGGGSTIMAYAGITGSTNVQRHSDPYFHAASLQQITTFIKTTTCPSTENTGNSTPTVNAGSNLTLPVGTAFKLVGNASDADGDQLTYCWEQFNEDDAVTTYPNPNSSNSNSVLFRSYPPTESNIRYFPNLEDLTFGINATQWEKVPNVDRTADFRLTVRDNRPGGANNAHDDMRVTFSSAYGPFSITSQNTPNILWESGTNETITWNVNNTNNLSGASNVNILLSTNGGMTYEHTLASNTPNDGSHIITVPHLPAPYCRILIEPTNNNFFAINTTDFAINYIVSKTCTQYSSAPNLGINITDNGKDFTQSHTINIGDAKAITDINIGLDITHSYIGDLGIRVQGPDNTIVLLKSPSDCGNEENLISIFDDQAPLLNCLSASLNTSAKSFNDLLAKFNNKNSSGNWTIQLGDFEAGDEGTLNSWFVEICETTETLLDIGEPGDPNKLVLYPNPNTGEFTIQLYNPTKNNVDIKLYDLRNRLVYQETYNGSTNFEENVTLQNIFSGMYILKISNGVKEFTKRVIIK